MAEISLNDIDVDFKDYYDMKGDIFHIVKETEDEINYNLVRERQGTYLIVGFDKNKESFQERIQNARKL